MNTDYRQMIIDFANAFHYDIGEVDLTRIEALVRFWGMEKVNNSIQFILINGYRKPTDGKKHNPYGLIYSLCHKVKFER